MIEVFDYIRKFYISPFRFAIWKSNLLTNPRCFYKNSRQNKTDWIKEVKERLTSDFERELDQFEDLEFGDVACLLIENCPQNQQIEIFLQWLDALSATQMYELLAPHLRERDSHILKEKMFVWFPFHSEQSNFNDILNIGKCLSDQKRLKILQFLSTGKYTFTDVLKYIGGAKGNIHHHVMTLRAAGLVRVHIEGDGQTFYASTRKTFVSELKEKLDKLLHVQE